MSNVSIPSRAAVVIVGGGMAGLSCASSLAQQGVSDVVLLEAKTLAHACLLYTSPSPRDPE